MVLDSYVCVKGLVQIAPKMSKQSLITTSANCYILGVNCAKVYHCMTNIHETVTMKAEDWWWYYLVTIFMTRVYRLEETSCLQVLSLLLTNENFLLNLLWSSATFYKQVVTGAIVTAGLRLPSDLGTYFYWLRGPKPLKCDVRLIT